MDSIVGLISKAIRGKLVAQGVRSLSEAEWHLLRISHLMHALDDRTLDRVLGDTPLGELIAIADALQTIGAIQAARRLRAVTERLAAANHPGRGLQRSETVTELAKELGFALAGLREDIETRLLDFAFQQRELAIEFAATA